MKHFPDRSTMQAPGLCFVCERTPDEGTGYVDTLTSFTPGFPSNLAGAKYICDACVAAAAEAAGFYADSTVKESSKTARIAEGKLVAVVTHVQEVAKQLEEAVLQDAADKAPVVAAEAAAEVEAVESKKAAKPKAEPEASAEDAAAEA